MNTAITLDNLVAYILQSGVLIGAALGALWILRIDIPGVRYLALRVTLAAVLVLPMLQPRIDAVREPGTVPAIAFRESTGTPGSAASPRRFSLAARSVGGGPSAAAIGTVLLAGVLARLAWLGLGLWRIQLLRRLGETAAGPEYADLQETIGTSAELRYVAGLGQPITFGFRVPLVLLPESLRRMNEPTRRAVVAHELWHVRRRDWIFMIGEETLRAAFWFHPAMWLLLSRIQVAREETVDELAVLTTGSRRAYLDALLAFANARPLFGTTAFARRRHLLHRMLVVSKESVMSSKRLVISCGIFAVLVVGAASSAVAAFPLALQQPPPPPPPPRDREMVFVPASETEMQDAIRRDPRNPQHYRALANHYVKAGDFDRAIATLESLALTDASNPQYPHLIAVFYWEKAFRDTTLSREQKVTYLHAGIAASDRALALSPDYAEAMTYKNILLRILATHTTDPAEQRRLTQEADTLRNRAIELIKQRPAATVDTMRRADGAPPPPPPPPPPPGPVDGTMPIRVGGNVAPPAKIRDVKPEYPPEARAAGVSGLVILEAVIDANGNVRDARVLKSVPLLDQAALDAVRQWQFTPTRLNNTFVPVIMTVTLNFSLQ